MMWQMHDGWGWWMVLGWVWMVVFWGLIVWAVSAIITRLAGSRGAQQPDEPDALAILERRYARGELTSEQFEEMRSRLQQHDGPHATPA
jgi:putative membrane protein